MATASEGQVKVYHVEERSDGKRRLMNQWGGCPAYEHWIPSDDTTPTLVIGELTPQELKAVRPFLDHWEANGRLPPPIKGGSLLTRVDRVLAKFEFDDELGSVTYTNGEVLIGDLAKLLRECRAEMNGSTPAPPATGEGLAERIAEVPELAAENSALLAEREDLRLLASAMWRGMFDHDNTTHPGSKVTLWVHGGTPITRIGQTTIDPNGLPVMTDELRAALRAALNVNPNEKGT